MAKLMMDGIRVMTEIPVILDNTVTGSKKISVPFEASYIAVLNNSSATVSYKLGQLVDKPADTVDVKPYIYLSLPVETGTTFTLFWDGGGSAPAAPNNKVLLIFSNEEINLQGGAMTTGGVSSNVAVTNSPTVNIGTMPQQSVQTMPAIQGSDYGSPANNHTVKVDANGLLHVSLESDTDSLAKDGIDGTGITPPTGGSGIRGWLSGIYKAITGTLTATLAAGANTIGNVGLNAGTNQIGHVVVDAGSSTIGTVNLGTTAGLPQAATAGFGAAASVSVGTAATAIVNAVVNAKQIVIQNQDAANPIYLGNSGVTTAAGIQLAAGASTTMDIVSGSTIAIYGICASGTIKVVWTPVN